MIDRLPIILDKLPGWRPVIWEYWHSSFVSLGHIRYITVPTDLIWDIGAAYMWDMEEVYQMVR